MKTIIRAMLGACALMSGLTGALAATEPNQGTEAGQVLLLDNERIVEGIIVREGNRYRIRRELGESWIPADKVIRLCASRVEAFKTLRSRANLQDLDERLRLARWCQLHGLVEEGRGELEGALAINSSCAEAKRLLRCFQRDAEPANPPPGGAAEVPTPPAPVKDAAAPLALPNAGLTMEAATLFSTRVQPILMNACASCHASERGGSFRLIHTYGESALNQRATQVNLAAAVAQVNRAHVVASPLLGKSVSIHGDLPQPPLKGRQVPAYRSLEDWARLVADCMPETPVASAMPARAEGSVAARATPLDDAAQPKPSEWASEITPPPSKPAPAGVTKPEPPAAEPRDVVRHDVPRSVSTTPPPRPPQEPADEFDALHFNREAHPERLDGPAPAPTSPLPGPEFRKEKKK